MQQRNANMKHPEDIGVMPAQLGNPLAMAVANRDTQTLEMVRASVSHKNIMLAYQPVVQAQNPSLAERLILEITERSTMLVPELVARFMSDLQARGISFALDDFGAGHTAFRHFKQFHFDILKIDGQFIRNIAHDPDNQVITQALVAIGQQFDMFTVAECVETPAEMAWLQTLGIDCLQGYHFGAPTLTPPWKTRPNS